MRVEATLNGQRVERANGTMATYRLSDAGAKYL